MFKVGDLVKWKGTSGLLTEDGKYSKEYAYEVIDAADDDTILLVDVNGDELWVNNEDFELATSKTTESIVATPQESTYELAIYGVGLSVNGKVSRSAVNKILEVLAKGE